MDLRRFLRLLAAVAAVAAVVVGRLALSDQGWLDWLLELLGLRGSNRFDLFPGVIGSGHVVSLGVAVAGCLLLALALPAVSGECAAARPTAQPRLVVSRGALGWAALAGVLVLVAAVLLRRPAPGGAAAWLWFAALLASGVAAWRIDRASGSALGSPFESRRELLGVAALALLELLLVGHDVGHWAWAGTPDEGNFYPFALDIARGTSPHFVLSETGMYNVHPLLSSHWQAAFMRVFGRDVFGWRFSSAAALALSLPAVYLLGRELWNRRVGLWPAVLFGTSPLAVGFSHFGYNNSQIYLFITWAPAVFLWARRRGSALGYWLTGAIGGLAVFTFYPARMALPLVFLLAFALRERPWQVGRRTLWQLLALGALIGATPCLVHPLATLGRMFGQTAFKPAEESAPDGSVGQRALAAVAGKGARLARHWAVSLLHPIWYPRPSHFQSAAVIDPLQGALAVTGFFLAWRSFRRHAGCRYLALAAAFSALLVGAVSQHDCPPLTRLLFLCPFTALLAVLALERILAPLRDWKPRLATVVGALAVGTSALWGLGILRYNVYVRNHGYGEGTTSEVIRVARAVPPGWRVVFAQRWPSYMQGVDNFAAAYGVGDRVTWVRQSPEVLRHLPGEGERRFVVAQDLPEGDDRRHLEAFLQERFPGGAWVDTAPGRKWNLRLYAVGEGGEGGWTPPAAADESAWRRMLLGPMEE